MDKKKVFTILRIAVSIVLLIVVVKLADVGKVVKSLKDFKLIWLLPIFLLIFLSVVISTLKWRTLIKAQGVTIKFITLFSYYNCGLFFNNFLPSSIGGDGIRIYLAGKRSETYSASASSVVMERTIATVSLAFLGLISSVLATKPSRIAVYLLAGLFVVGIVLAFVLISAWVPKGVRKKDGKIARAFINFADSAKELKDRKKELFLCFVQSIVFQAVVAFVIQAIMVGLAQPVLSLPDLFLITSASSVLAMVPLGLNGYGMREGAYIYLLKPFGYTTSAALTVSVLFAFFVSIYSLLGGLNWIFISKENSRTAKLIKSEM